MYSFGFFRPLFPNVGARGEPKEVSSRKSLIQAFDLFTFHDHWFLKNGKTKHEP